MFQTTNQLIFVDMCSYLTMNHLNIFNHASFMNKFEIYWFLNLNLLSVGAGSVKRLLQVASQP